MNRDEAIAALVQKVGSVEKVRDLIIGWRNTEISTHAEHLVYTLALHALDAQPDAALLEKATSFEEVAAECGYHPDSSVESVCAFIESVRNEARESQDSYRRGLIAGRAERKPDAAAVRVATEARDIAERIRTEAASNDHGSKPTEAWTLTQKCVMQMNLLLNRTIAAAGQPQPADARQDEKLARLNQWILDGHADSKTGNGVLYTDEDKIINEIGRLLAESDAGAPDRRDASGDKHTAACVFCDWRGPARSSFDEANADVETHDCEKHPLRQVIAELDADIATLLVAIQDAIDESADVNGVGDWPPDTVLGEAGVQAMQAIEGARNGLQVTLSLERFANHKVIVRRERARMKAWREKRHEELKAKLAAKRAEPKDGGA